MDWIHAQVNDTIVYSFIVILVYLKNLQIKFTVFKMVSFFCDIGLKSVKWNCFRVCIRMLMNEQVTLFYWFRRQISCRSRKEKLTSVMFKLKKHAWYGYSIEDIGNNCQVWSITSSYYENGPSLMDSQYALGKHILNQIDIDIIWRMIACITAVLCSRF